MDALATIPRAASISLINDYVNATQEDQKLVETTLDQLMRDPAFFGPEITDKILESLESGNFIKALKEEL